MSTVYSKPNVIPEARTNQDQHPYQESQIYSELSEECTYPNSDINYENDFDLFSAIVNAVNVAKSKCKISPINSLSKKASLTINIPVVFAIKVLMLTSRQSSAQHVLNGSTENVMVPLLRNTKS